MIWLALALIGTDEEPRWTVDMRPGGDSAAAWNRCCEGGHFTPEAAAAHGSELAALWLGQYARGLKPPSCGALAITKLEAVA